MSDTYEVELPGCTPEPLMSYLKALGILRIVSEQADADATACWKNDCFVLASQLDESGIVRLFLDDYRPTPIIGPWAGGSGFFGNDNRKAVESIAQSASLRAASYRKCIEKAKCILKDEGLVDKPSDDIKGRLLRRYRREMPDEFVQWIDAVMVLQSDGQAFAPVLGTGGNDGRLDFAQNFMLRLLELKLFDAESSAKSESLLGQSLLGDPVAGLGKSSVGQFSPGKAGGPNATQGMEGRPTDNPWDYVLMLEGTLLFAGSVVRRMGLASRDKAAFPFTVRSRPVGEASPTEKELDGSRGELWLPLWRQQVSLLELKSLFAEGRADFRARPAHDAVEFARAIAGLGIDRGISSFERYGFLKRSGKAYLAAAMNHFRVPDHPRDALDLLGQLDLWLDGFRRACSAKETPSRLTSGLRRIETEVFRYCQYGRREDMQALLIALGGAEHGLATTGGQRSGKEICRPLARLSPQWLLATHDGSLEYEIALALASVHDRERKVCAIRSNIEPVEFDKGRWTWREAGPHVVWGSADLSTNIAAVLLRRIMDGVRAGCMGLPLDFRRALSPEVTAAFIAGHVDDRRIEELLCGLLFVNHRIPYPANLPRATVETPTPLPRQYALLKLLFLPRPLVREWNDDCARWRLTRGEESGITIRPEPRILPLLNAGRVSEACRIAYQRLRVSGLTPLPGSLSSGICRDGDWEQDPSITPKRLAAALLLPVSDFTVNQLVNLVTRQDEESESETSINIGEDQS